MNLAINIANLPSPADQIVAAFVAAINSIDPPLIHGVYLTGSLPLQDFHPNKSDIDFIVLCRKLPDAPIAAQLKAIHKTIGKQYPKPNLSGSYLALDNLQAADPERIPVLRYHERAMRYGEFDMAPVSLTELKTTSITVYGPNVSTLPIRVDETALNRFLYKNINSYWTPWIHRHATSLPYKLLLLVFPRLTEWAVLGVARQLCTLQTGKIVSKTEAGLYCLAHLPVQFHAIIQEAIAIRKDNRTYRFVGSYGINPSFNRLNRSIECVRYIIALFKKICTNGQ